MAGGGRRGRRGHLQRARSGGGRRRERRRRQGCERQVALARQRAGLIGARVWDSRRAKGAALRSRCNGARSWQRLGSAGRSGLAQRSTIIAPGCAAGPPPPFCAAMLPGLPSLWHPSWLPVTSEDAHTMQKKPLQRQQKQCSLLVCVRTSCRPPLRLPACAPPSFQAGGAKASQQQHVQTPAALDCASCLERAPVLCLSWLPPAGCGTVRQPPPTCSTAARPACLTIFLSCPYRCRLGLHTRVPGQLAAAAWHPHATVPHIS